MAGLLLPEIRLPTTGDRLRPPRRLVVRGGPPPPGTGDGLPMEFIIPPRVPGLLLLLLLLLLLPPPLFPFWGVAGPERDGGGPSESLMATGMVVLRFYGWVS